MRKKYELTVFMALIFFSAACAYGAQVSMDVEPNAVYIGASYNGMDITVSGKVPLDTEAVVRLVSKGENFNLKKKGKAMGLLWMNMGTVSFHNCPSIFMVSIPKKLSWASGKDKGKWESLGLGLTTVENQVEISPEQEDKDKLFNEFVKLKEKEGKYATNRDGIQYNSENSTTKKFSTKIAIPAGVVTGQYKVEAFAVKNGAVVGKTDKMIKVSQVGLPKFLSSLAFDHSLIYGIMAVLVALMAGLITGLVFKGGGGAH